MHIQANEACQNIKIVPGAASFHPGNCSSEIKVTERKFPEKINK